MALKEYKKFKKQENVHFTILLLYNIKGVVGGGGIVHKDNGSDISRHWQTDLFLDGDVFPGLLLLRQLT